MNSKELVEQATERIRKINILSASIEEADKVLGNITDNTCICLGSPIMSFIYIDRIMAPEVMDRILNEVVAEIDKAKLSKSIELEELLGIRKPAIVNQEFEQAVLEMEEQQTKKTLVVETKNAKCVVVQKDPVEAKLTDILQGEAKKIEDKPIPPIMTVERVKELYHEKDMTLDRVAKIFEVNPSALYRFVVANNLRKPRGKEPETECPTDTKEF